MVAVEECESNNFLSELKNVLQRFGHLDTGCVMPLADDVTGSVSSDSDRKCASVAGSASPVDSENLKSPYVGNGGPTPRSPHGYHRSHFWLRRPLTPISKLRRELSPLHRLRTPGSEDEYPPKSPPMTVFQHRPGGVFVAGSEASTSLESVETTEIRPGVPTSRREGHPSSQTITLTKSSLASASPPSALTGGIGGREARTQQTDLYNELNTVLRRRNQQGKGVKTVLDIQKLKSGKTTVYYGKGRQGYSSDKGFSPSLTTRGRAATVDGQTRPPLRKLLSGLPLDRVGVTNSTGPPTPPPLPASADTTVATTTTTTTTNSTTLLASKRNDPSFTDNLLLHNGSTGVVSNTRRVLQKPPATLRSHNGPPRADLLAACSLPTPNDDRFFTTPTSLHGGPPAAPLVPPTHPSPPLLPPPLPPPMDASPHDPVTMTPSDLVSHDPGGRQVSLLATDGATNVVTSDSQQPVGRNDSGSDGGGDCDLEDWQNSDVGSDGELPDPHNCPTLPLRPRGGGHQVAPEYDAGGHRQQHMPPRTPSPPPLAVDRDEDEEDSEPPSHLPVFKTPSGSPLSPDGGSCRDLTDPSFSCSDYDVPMPMSPTRRRGISSDDSVTSGDAGVGVSGYKRPARRRAPKALSWHSLMFVTGDERWIEHYALPVDAKGTSDSFSKNPMGAGSNHYRGTSHGNLQRSEKLFKSSGLPSSRPPAQRRRWVQGPDVPPSVYATYPPPRWTRSGGGKDDDLLTSLLLTHSGERIPSDGESNIGRGMRVAAQGTARLKANVTVPQPTSFHRHGNHVCNHLISTGATSSPVMTSPTPPLLPDISSPEPDYDLTGTDEDEHHTIDTDDHVGCHVCMSLADESSEKVMDTEKEEEEEGYPLLGRMQSTDATEGEGEAEAEDSTDLDAYIKNRNSLILEPQTKEVNTKRRANGSSEDKRSFHQWAEGARLTSMSAQLTASQQWPRRSNRPTGDDSDSSAYRAWQWCRSVPPEVCAANAAHVKQPVISDCYSSDDARQLATTSKNNNTGKRSLPPPPSGMRSERSYSVANSIQSMCTYILDSYDHSSDADTESLYQDYDAYEKALIQYVRTEDLSRMNADIRSLYWQQLDAHSLRTLRLQPRRILHKFMCCFMCDQPLRTRARACARQQAAAAAAVKAAKAHTESLKSGCPLTQKITDDASVTVYGKGLLRGEEGKAMSFLVKCDSPNAHGDLWVQVDGPNSIAKCNIESREPGLYQVTYVPVETGSYTIQIKWNGKLLVGCPYHPRIGRSSDSTKVVMVQSGTEPSTDGHGALILKVNQVKSIEFDAARAGTGALTAQLAGPHGPVPCDIHQLGDRKFVITFTPTHEGEYRLSVFYAGTHVAMSPFSGIAQTTGPVVNHEKVVLTGRGLKEVRVREEAEFVVDGRGTGAGIPNVILKGVKADIEVTCLPIGNNMYQCCYKATIPGAYLLYIMWSDCQVKGSPFKVNVISASDASRVVCTGEGLKMGVMGQEIKSVIDTRRAGPGELTAHCQGPRKEAYCSLTNNHDGTFTLTIKPQEAGRHTLTIKYDDEHVPGSPFRLRVSGAPDASKVRVNGPGIDDGLLAIYQSRFIVETRGAGAGQLTVRIRGPKGAFRVEMQRESSKDRTILCRYDPTEIGDYLVHVKWSGEHVPGSPFHIHIADTQDELERFKMEGTIPNSSRTMESRVHNMEF